MAILLIWKFSCFFFFFHIEQQQIQGEISWSCFYEQKISERQIYMTAEYLIFNITLKVTAFIVNQSATDWNLIFKATGKKMQPYNPLIIWKTLTYAFILKYWLIPVESGDSNKPEHHRKDKQTKCFIVGNQIPGKRVAYEKV